MNTEATQPPWRVEDLYDDPYTKQFLAGVGAKDTDRGSIMGLVGWLKYEKTQTPEKRREKLRRLVSFATPYRGHIQIDEIIDAANSELER